MPNVILDVAVPTVVIHTPLDSTAKLNYMYRNRIINGDFSAWQRGASFAISLPATAIYTADRWAVYSNGTITRQAFLAGESEAIGNDRYYFRMPTNTLGGGASRLMQAIEDVRTLAGSQATLTLWSKGTAGQTITASITQCFGTGGAPSDNVVTSSTAVTVSTGWTKHTVVFTIPSIAGKTIGTDENSYLLLNLAMGIVQTDIAHVQLENGSTATDFETRLPGEEMRLAKRYYEQLDYAAAMRVPLTGQSYSATIARLTMAYLAKRIAPTVTVPAAIQIQNAAFDPKTVTWTTELAALESADMIAEAVAGLTIGEIIMSRASGATAITIDAEYSIAT